MLNLTIIGKHHLWTLSALILFGIVTPLFYLNNRYSLIVFPVLVLVYYVLLSLMSKTLTMTIKTSQNLLKKTLLIVFSTCCYNALLISVIISDGIRGIMMFLSFVLFIQALSANFDNMLIGRAGIFVMDIVLLGLTAKALYNIISIGYHLYHYVLPPLVITIALSIAKKYGVAPLILPILTYILWLLSDMLSITLIFASVVSYIQGYMESLESLPTITLTYSNKSIILLLSSTLLMTAVMAQGLYIIPFTYLVYIISIITLTTHTIINQNRASHSSIPL